MDGVFLVVIIILLIICFPLLGVWSLNVLFGLGIAYTFKTWLASFILISLLTGSAASTK